MVWVISGQFGENLNSLKYLKKTKIVENSDKKNKYGPKGDLIREIGSIQKTIEQEMLRMLRSVVQLDWID